MSKHLFALIVGSIIIGAYVASWWAGYYAGIERERKRAFDAGCAHYRVLGSETEFVYGGVK